MSGYHTVSVKLGLLHPEVCAAVLYEHVVFLKAALVKKLCNSLTGSEFPFLMLSIDSFLATSHAGFGPALDKLFDLFLLNTHNLYSIKCFPVCYSPDDLVFSQNRTNITSFFQKIALAAILI